MPLLPEPPGRGHHDAAIEVRGAEDRRRVWYCPCALSKYSRHEFVENPKRAIHLFDIRLVADTSNPL